MKSGKPGLPPEVTNKQYFSSSKEERARLRIKYNFKLSDGIFYHDLPDGHKVKLNGSHVSVAAVAVPTRKAGPRIDDQFPRTTEGASAFIRAWQKSPDAETFIAKFGNNEKNFWGAACYRAEFFRKKGIELKKLRKSKSMQAAAYDWDQLKLVAAEVAE